MRWLQAAYTGLSRMLPSRLTLDIPADPSSRNRHPLCGWERHSSPIIIFLSYLPTNIFIFKIVNIISFAGSLTHFKIA
jgi:hypothetical protein